MDIYTALMASGRNYAQEIQAALLEAVQNRVNDGELAQIFLSGMQRNGLPWPAPDNKAGKPMLKLWRTSAATWTFPPDPEAAKP